MSDVIVVGAGVVGAALTWNLTRRGIAVQLLDSGEPGHGTSGTTFAMDVTTRKTPRHYFEFAHRAGELHDELTERFADTSWRHIVPSVEWGVTDHDHEVTLRRRERMLEWGYESQLEDVANLADLAPGLRLPNPGTATAVVYRHGRWYAPAKFVDAMLRDAQAHGARVHTGVTVTELHRAGGRIRGVVTSSGVWESHMVVDCAGPNAARLAAMAGIDLPLDRVPGIIGHLEPVTGTPVQSIWTLWSLNLRPAPGNQVCVHSYDVDAQLPPDIAADDQVPPELHEQLRARTATLLPDVNKLRTRIGVRPVPHDGLPLVGNVASTPGFYPLVSHSGIHLAPLLGELAAREIAEERHLLELAPYRPNRAADGHRRDSQDESMREMNRVLHQEPST